MQVGILQPIANNDWLVSMTSLRRGSSWPRSVSRSSNAQAAFGRRTPAAAIYAGGFLSA